MLKSNKITLSAICAALAVVMLVAMTFFRYMTIAMSVAAALIIIIPLLKDKAMFWYSAAAYAAAVVLSVLLTWNFVDMALFTFLFSPYLVGKVLLDGNENVSKAKNLACKYAILNAGLFLTAALNILFLGEELLKNTITIIIFIGVFAVCNAALVFIDRLIGLLLKDYYALLVRLKI